jgi:low density lipoprotein-related protein 2
MKDDIYIVHLPTNGRAIFTNELRWSTVMAVDTVEMKLYVEDSSHIWMKDINGADASIVVENANPKGMAVDWIGRRIFWAEYISWRISVANLDGKERRVVTNTLGYPRAIAIDSLSG